jgi:hypothetical protein
MIADPVERGRALAAFWLAVAPRLWDDLVESEVLPPGDATARARQRGEWDCLALDACVRGLLAACGFDDDTASAIDAMHERVLEAWMLEPDSPDDFDERRARVGTRYQEFGAIAITEVTGEDAAGLSLRLGHATALHMAQGDAPPALAELVGTLHATLVAGATEAVRIGVQPA